MPFYSCQVSRSCKSTGGILDTVDACSLLYRLQMEGEAQSVKPGNHLLTRCNWLHLVKQSTLRRPVDPGCHGVWCRCVCEGPMA